MGVKQAIVAPGQSLSCLAASIAYFASFSGTSYSAQLQVNINDDWLPVGAVITEAGNMAAVLFTGRLTDTYQQMAWRWNVTAINGTLTVYLG